MKDQAPPKTQSIFSRIKNYLGYPGKVLDAFLEKHPKIKKVYEILTHTTTIRIIALAIAIAATVLSGGAVPSALILTFTVLGASIAIFTKAKQLYNAEQVTQQKLIANKIAKDEVDYKGLLDSLSPADKIKFNQNTINAKLEHQKTHHITSPDSTGIFKGLRKTLRDTGIENLVPLASYALSGDFIGTSIYAIFLLFITKKEVSSRIESSKKKYEVQDQINDLCSRYKIKEYKNTRDLFIYYLEKKSDFQALEKTMKECKRFDEEVFKRHKDNIFGQLLHTELNTFIDKKQQVNKVADLQEPSFWRCFLFTVNPFKKVDVGSIYEKYQSVTPSITPPPEPGTVGKIRGIKIPRSIPDSFLTRSKTTTIKTRKNKEPQLGG